MKYGKKFNSEIVPGWAEHYIPYLKLKKRIKLMARSRLDGCGVIPVDPEYEGPKASEDTSEETFRTEFVDGIKHMILFFDNQTPLFVERYNRIKADMDHIAEEIKVQKAASNECVSKASSDIRQLAWDIMQMEKFIVLNCTAATKLLKKHDKLLGRVPGLRTAALTLINEAPMSSSKTCETLSMKLEKQRKRLDDMTNASDGGGVHVMLSVVGDELEKQTAEDEENVDASLLNGRATLTPRYHYSSNRNLGSDTSPSKMSDDISSSSNHVSSSNHFNVMFLSRLAIPLIAMGAAVATYMYPQQSSKIAVASFVGVGVIGALQLSLDTSSSNNNCKSPALELSREVSVSWDVAESKTDGGNDKPSNSDNSAASVLSHEGSWPTPSKAHGMMGRLIVVEGLDGSGKSTQLDMLRDWLEGNGFRVVITRWCSSPLLSDVIKGAKRAKKMTPATFTLMAATDLAEQMKHIIRPALRAGLIVLSDRYFFTSLARDKTRGMDPEWLRNLYSFAVKPDLVMYFRVPVKTAIGRVMARRQFIAEQKGKGLAGEDSDGSDGEEDKKKKKKMPNNNRDKEVKIDDSPPKPREKRPLVNYYEAGLDLNLSEDPLVNFELFQTRVTSEYDKMVKEFDFVLIQANRPRLEQHAEVIDLVTQSMGISHYLKNIPTAGPGDIRVNIFDKNPSNDRDQVRENYLHRTRGVHFFFRNAILTMQARFAQLVSHNGIPLIFIHGNPHIDNFACNWHGCSMVDFDRSRYGPYCWDLARVLVSVSLRQQIPHPEFVADSVVECLLNGYRDGYNNPHKKPVELESLKEAPMEYWERSTNDYVEASAGWISEMERNLVSNDNAEVMEVLLDYIENLGERLFDRFVIEKVACTESRISLDTRVRYLVLLKPKEANSVDDRILLDLKQVRRDPDTRWYKTKHSHDGIRMTEASKLYSPGWGYREAHATAKNGDQYWVRQICPLNRKLKRALNEEEQGRFLFVVGNQLGRGHRKAIEMAKLDPSLILKHLDEHMQSILEAGLAMRFEIISAHRRYLKKCENLKTQL